MKENLENTYLNLRVTPNTKAVFKECFKESNYKKVNDFLASFLSIKMSESKTSEDKEGERNRFEIRITAAEKKFIKDLFSKSSEKRMGSFIIKCIKDTPLIIENVTVLGEGLSVELNKIGTNLNQIALRANQHGMVDTEAIVLLNEIKARLFTLTNLK